MLAPIGVQKVVHPDGELATARAAAALGLPMIASTASAFTLEEIAEAGGEAPRWFQLYWPNDRALAASLVDRAEAAGYGAIVLTVDTFVPGWKPRDLQQAWLPFLNGVGVANYFQDPVFRAALEKTPEEDVGMATGHFLGIQANPSLSWDDLAWLREQTKLPILIKGIQHPDDAREAANRGIDGIVVSNHGGRQVDGALGSLDALPAIAEAVRQRPSNPLRQRHPQRQRRNKGPRPRRRRRLPGPPLHLGPRPGGPSRRRNGAEDGPRGVRPISRPLRLHAPGPTRPRLARLEPVPAGVGTSCTFSPDRRPSTSPTPTHQKS